MLVRAASISAVLSLGLLAQGQELVSYSSNGQLYPAIYAQRYGKVFKDVQRPDVRPELVRLFKTVYRSRMPDGRRAQLSGLLAVPASGAPKGLVIYFHGTTSDKENVPSRYRGNPTPEETDIAILAFTGAGYAVAAPDYLGLGDHQGVHPFPLASINCLSGIDIIKPARAIAAKEGLSIGKDLFVTGFSEGGAVAMWALRRMERMSDPDYLVKRVAPLSGPYDLSGTQAQSVISRQSNMKWLGARIYFSAYAAYGIQRYLQEVDLNDYFTPSFASYIPFVFEQRLNDKQTIEKLVKKGFQMGTLTDLNRILKLDFRNALKARDLTDPVVIQLIANDCFDWAPKTPTYLFCVEDDFVVPKENTIVAISAMRARGVGPDIVNYYTLPGRKFDHGTGIFPGILLARMFFDGGFTAVPTSAEL